jgi:putative addiction module component (TIGR02574 family)
MREASGQAYESGISARIGSMSQSAEKVFEEALELTEDERLDLAHKLLHSVSELPLAESQEPLRETITRRVADLTTGRVKAIPGDEATALLRERLAKRRGK